jgi:MFS family permease
MLNKIKTTWSSLHPDAIRLNVASIITSLPFGYMTIIAPIYFNKIGLDPVLIGQLFTVSSVTCAVLLVLFGFLADRFGRKPFVMAGTLLPVVSYVIFLSTRDPLLLNVAAALGGVGLANGLSGALASAGFNALLAEKSDDANRNLLFSITNAGWTAALMAGSLLGGLPEWLQQYAGMGVVESYRPLFWLSLVVSVIGMLFLIPVKEDHRYVPRPRHTEGAQRSETLFTRPTLAATIKFSIFMGLIGLGLGFGVQLMPLWYYLKFGASGDVLGPWYAIGELGSTLAVFGAPWLARRWGTVRAVLVLQGLSAVALGGMVAAPVTWLAALLMVARTTVLNMSWPLQQSYIMSVIEPHSRAAVNGITFAAWGLASSASPILAGIWLDQRELGLPMLAGAACYALSAISLFVFFRHVRPREETPQPAAVAVTPETAS